LHRVKTSFLRDGDTRRALESAISACKRALSAVSSAAESGAASSEDREPHEEDDLDSEGEEEKRFPQCSPVHHHGGCVAVGHPTVTRE
jgi:hypothetical protein